MPPSGRRAAGRWDGRHREAAGLGPARAECREHQGGAPDDRPRPATAAARVMALSPRAGKAVLPTKVTSADILGRRLSGKSPTGWRDPGAMRAAGEGVLSTGTPEPAAILWRRSPVQVAWAAQAPGTLSGLRPPPGVPRPSPEDHTRPLRAAMAQPPQHRAPQTRPGLGQGRPSKSRWPAPDGRPHCPDSTLFAARARPAPGASRVDAQVEKAPQDPHDPP